MPDIPESAVGPAAEALCELHHLDPDWARTLARAALEAAAPLLAEAVAEKIAAHMENHGPRRPRGPLESELYGPAYRAWCRHFSIAARVAAGAFSTREDQVRKMAEAIERGDYMRCDIPEVPDA
jgi:hypothetical protein